MISLTGLIYIIKKNKIMNEPQLITFNPRLQLDNN